MSSFTDQLDLRDLGDRTFQLLSPFTYHVGIEESDEVIIVPQGFITDFASVPRIFWNIFPPYGKYGKAAVVHDALYQTKGMRGKYTRKECDEIFLQCMEVLNVGFLTRRIIYRNVRMFGWYMWNKSKDDRIDQIKTDTDLSYREIKEAPLPTVK
jgi:hypothetical protein